MNVCIKNLEKKQKSMKITLLETEEKQKDNKILGEISL